MNSGTSALPAGLACFARCTWSLVAAREAVGGRCACGRRPPWPAEARRSPGLDPAAAAAAPLRGRGPEVKVLGEVLDRVAAGRPALALIKGEAGIGKTR